MLYWDAAAKNWLFRNDISQHWSLVAALCLCHSLRLGWGQGWGVPPSLFYNRRVGGWYVCGAATLRNFRSPPPSCCSPDLTVKHTKIHRDKHPQTPVLDPQQPLDPPSSFLRLISALSGGIHAGARYCSFPPAPSLALFILSFPHCMSSLPFILPRYLLRSFTIWRENCWQSGSATDPVLSNPVKGLKDGFGSRFIHLGDRYLFVAWLSTVFSSFL